MASSIAICLLAITTGIVLVTFRKYRERQWGKCRNSSSLEDKVVIVTGANSGLGYTVAKRLTLRKGQVIMACRDMQKTFKAIERMELELRGRNLIYKRPIAMVLDLSNLKSIRDFVEKVGEQYQNIDILVNNAGIAYSKGKVEYSEDGVEMHMAVNHLGHFCLTNLLLPHMTELKGKPRVVIVSSSLHERGSLECIDSKTLLTNGDLYANSKLANVLFAKELAKRRPEVNVYALCPGWVYTNLFRHHIRWWHYVLVAPIAYFFMRTPYQGSETILYCCTEPVISDETGLLYKDCKHYESKKLKGSEDSELLWDMSISILTSKGIEMV